MTNHDKLEKIREFCIDELSSFDEKPNSQENPFGYGYLSGVQTALESILDILDEEE